MVAGLLCHFMSEPLPVTTGFAFLASAACPVAQVGVGRGSPCLSAWTEEAGLKFGAWMIAWPGGVLPSGGPPTPGRGRGRGLVSLLECSSPFKQQEVL